MISIDRHARTSVSEQLIEQLRYQIASGQIKVGEVLPSTRALAKQLAISFHTVRKAYQQLEQEGLLESRKGSGFTVKERVQLEKGERMEKGAALVHETLHRMIALGLEEGEIEYLFQEQMDMLETDALDNKLLFAAPFREKSERCAEQIARFLQYPVEAVLLDQLDRHQDADYICTTPAILRDVRTAIPKADVFSLVTYFPPKTLEEIAKLLPQHTLGILTRSGETIPHIMTEIRKWTGFSGHMLAASTADEAHNLRDLLRQTDLLVYTPKSKRKLIPYLSERAHAPLDFLITPDSLEALRQAIPV